MNTGKFVLFSVGFICTVGGLCQAEEADDASPRIDYPLSVATWMPPPPPVPLPARPVLEETEYVLPAEGRSILVQRVVPPEQPPPAPPVTSSLTEEELAAGRERIALLAKSYRRPVAFMFSCTVYDHKATRVGWWYQGKRYEAWSNLDWNDFTGVGSFVIGSDPHRRAVFLGLGNVDTVSPRPTRFPKAPAVPIPEIPVDGPGYVLISGDAVINPDAIKPLEEMHALHRAEGARLREARLKREEYQRAREAWIEANPPQPRDTVIQFGRKGRQQ